MSKPKSPAKNKTAALAKQMSIAAKLKEIAGVKSVLHLEVGETKTALHKHFMGPEWKVFTLNIDSRTPADFHIYPTNLSAIPNETFDAVWSNHTLKFFYSTEIPVIFKELHRILKKDGVFTLSGHNLKRVADTMRVKGLEGILYETNVGPVTVLDVLYGFRKFLKGDNKPFVVPKTGFSTGQIANLLTAAGFLNVNLVEEGISVSGAGYKREKKTEENSKVKIIPIDMNKVMLERDRIDIPPTPVGTKTSEKTGS